MSEAEISFIQHRNSASRLKSPAPNKNQLEEIFKAAIRAPDHGKLKPWRFIVIENEGLQQLGQLFVEIQQVDTDLTPEQCQKIAAKPLRAPMIIVVIAKVVEHAKVPACEQIHSAVCAAQNILLATEALGFASIWRTGAMAYNKNINSALGLLSSESIVGFIYVGMREGERKNIPEENIGNFVRVWP